MDKELIEKIIQTIESKLWRKYREHKAERIADLCKEHYRKVAIKAVEEVIDEYRMAEEYVDLLDYAIIEINDAMK